MFNVKVKQDKKLMKITMETNIWGKIFKNGPSKICGRQPLKNLLGPLLNTLLHFKDQNIKIYQKPNDV